MRRDKGALPKRVCPESGSCMHNGTPQIYIRVERINLEDFGFFSNFSKFFLL